MRIERESQRTRSCDEEPRGGDETSGEPSYMELARGHHNAAKFVERELGHRREELQYLAREDKENPAKERGAPPRLDLAVEEKGSQHESRKRNAHAREE